MKNNLIINSIKERIKNYNVVIYGTIRDIENDFLTSFINMELIGDLFNNVYYIILENDSKDSTRELLTNWKNQSLNQENKKIILMDGLDDYFPLRATRLAFCRNKILNYMRDKNFEETYQYAIHCDLDNRFWSMDIDNLCQLFDSSQNNNWDMISVVSSGRSYYDFWALRYEDSWFNKNIFSCANEGIEYETKIDTFVTILRNSEGLIPVQSAFNGLAVYKIKSLLNSSYDSSYKCKICNNFKTGCREDNDHIGLHEKMLYQGNKLFINNKIEINSRKPNYMPFKNFINNTNPLDLKKNVLTWLLFMERININKDALFIGEKLSLHVNSYSKYYIEFGSCNKVYYLCNEDPWFLNDNVYKLKELSSLKNEIFSFIYIESSNYNDLKTILSQIKKFISSGTILYFTNFFNYDNYYKYNYKAFYEFVQLNNISFKWGYFNSSNNELKGLSVEIIEILIEDEEDLFIDYNDNEYAEFDWIKYTNEYPDLCHVTHKDNAFRHWKLYGKIEGRQYFTKEKNIILSNNQNKILLEDNFDWEMYLDLNIDLREAGIETEVDSINHWLKHGKLENRKHKFDWCKYIENNNLLVINIDNKEKAILHWKENGCPDQEDIDLGDKLFDWEYYINNNLDLKHINTREEAKSHWETFGKKEGRKCHAFCWTEYLMENPELVNEGIDTEFKALNHWMKNISN